MSRRGYSYQPVPPMDLYEIEAGRRYRAIVARSLGGKTDRFGPPAEPVTRIGIAVDAGLRMRQLIEAHARDVGRRLGLTDGRPERGRHAFGSR